RPALVGPGDPVLDEDEAEVALARHVDGRARAVTEVAPREHERGDAERTQVRFERRLEEGAPARLVDDHLAGPGVLDAAGEEKLRVEAGRVRGDQARSELRARRAGQDEARSLRDGAAAAEVDVAAVGPVEADDVHD